MAESKAPKLSKDERVAIFLKRLRKARAVATSAAAYTLVCETLNEVEDEYSGVAYNPSAWLDDGRRYPAQEDQAQALSGGVTIYRHRGHKTYLADNGAIVIWDIFQEAIVFSKRGKNGKKVPSSAIG